MSISIDAIVPLCNLVIAHLIRIVAAQHSIVTCCDRIADRYIALTTDYNAIAAQYIGVASHHNAIVLGCNRNAPQCNAIATPYSEIETD